MSAMNMNIIPIDHQDLTVHQTLIEHRICYKNLQNQTDANLMILRVP